MEKFNKQDLQTALSRLSMLKYWPSEPATRAELGGLLARMVPHKEALEWLVTTMTDKVGEYQGPAELRGLLCWHCRPADGIEAPCSLAGFTASDGERISSERAALDTEAQGVLADPGCRALVRSIADARRLA
jgi:hypothetical protein